MITLWASSRGTWGIDFRGYFGDLDRTRVFGRWKVVDRRTFRAFLPWTYMDSQHECCAKGGLGQWHILL